MSSRKRRRIGNYILDVQLLSDPRTNDKIWKGHSDQHPYNVLVRVITRNIFNQGNLWESRVSHLLHELTHPSRSWHPNLSLFYDLKKSSRQIYLVTEWCQGRDLHHWMPFVRFNIEMITSILFQIVSVLEYLHKNNLIFGGLGLRDVFIEYDHGDRLINQQPSNCRIKLDCSKLLVNHIVSESLSKPSSEISESTSSLRGQVRDFRDVAILGISLVLRRDMSPRDSERICQDLESFIRAKNPSTPQTDTDLATPVSGRSNVQDEKDIKLISALEPLVKMHMEPLVTAQKFIDTLKKILKLSSPARSSGNPILRRTLLDSKPLTNFDFTEECVTGSTTFSNEETNEARQNCDSNSKKNPLLPEAEVKKDGSSSKTEKIEHDVSSSSSLKFDSTNTEGISKRLRLSASSPLLLLLPSRLSLLADLRRGSSIDGTPFDTSSSTMQSEIVQCDINLANKSQQGNGETCECDTPFDLTLGSMNNPDFTPVTKHLESCGSTQNPHPALPQYRSPDSSANSSTPFSNEISSSAILSTSYCDTIPISNLNNVASDISENASPKSHSSLSSWRSIESPRNGDCLNCPLDGGRKKSSSLNSVKPTNFLQSTPSTSFEEAEAYFASNCNFPFPKNKVLRDSRRLQELMTSVQEKEKGHGKTTGEPSLCPEKIEEVNIHIDSKVKTQTYPQEPKTDGQQYKEGFFRRLRHTVMDSLLFSSSPNSALPTEKLVLQPQPRASYFFPRSQFPVSVPIFNNSRRGSPVYVPSLSNDISYAGRQICKTASIESCSIMDSTTSQLDMFVIPNEAASQVDKNDLSSCTGPSGFQYIDADLAASDCRKHTFPLSSQDASSYNKLSFRPEVFESESSYETMEQKQQEEILAIQDFSPAGKGGEPFYFSRECLSDLARMTIEQQLVESLVEWTEKRLQLIKLLFDAELRIEGLRTTTGLHNNKTNESGSSIDEPLVQRSFFFPSLSSDGDSGVTLFLAAELVYMASQLIFYPDNSIVDLKTENISTHALTVGLIVLRDAKFLLQNATYNNDTTTVDCLETHQNAPATALLHKSISLMYQLAINRSSSEILQIEGFELRIIRHIRWLICSLFKSKDGTVKIPGEICLRTAHSTLTIAEVLLHWIDCFYRTQDDKDNSLTVKDDFWITFTTLEVTIRQLRQMTYGDDSEVDY